MVEQDWQEVALTVRPVSLTNQLQAGLCEREAECSSTPSLYRQGSAPHHNQSQDQELALLLDESAVSIDISDYTSTSHRWGFACGFLAGAVLTAGVVLLVLLML